MKILKPFVFSVIIHSLILLSSSYAVSETDPDISGYKVGAENVLQIDVYYGRDREISRKVRVSSQGRINFPLLGEVDVAGLSVAEVEKKLTDLLDKDYLVNPQVSVFIEKYSTVSILGQVMEPGSFEIKGSLTLIELISLAGGLQK
jgi:polysaccharide export outer membrane protein